MNAMNVMNASNHHTVEETVVVREEGSTSLVVEQETSIAMIKEECNKVMEEEESVIIVVGEDHNKVVVEGNVTKVVVENEGNNVVVEEESTKVVVEEESTKVVVEENVTRTVVEKEDTKVVMGEDGVKVVTGEDGSKLLLLEEDTIPTHLSLEDYDCIGFDLDHTLCRYNIGPMVRLEYDLLATFLVDKHGYDPAIKHKTFDQDCDFVCKGLTLDIDKGNILRLGKDGYILTATHGTRKMTEIEIEKNYGRCRKKHMASDYAQHLQTHGPMGMNDFKFVVHSFMDYFDYATMLLCARIVDVLDQINNQGRPLEEYYFWPDVLEGLKEMFTRTHFMDDHGGYFPEIKANPQKYILKRSSAFLDWLKMLRANGKFLYVITGSNVDFASYVASYAVGKDWKELFDIVIFFARKPSFFIDRRPFYKLNGEKEVDAFVGIDELDTGHYYSQGNWHDLSEFMEYATEWEPSASLYFGDNILQDVLAPNIFTKNCDSVAVSEEMLAEGMVGHPASHPHAKDLTSPLWGSYFYYPEAKRTKGPGVLSRASSFRTGQLKESERPFSLSSTAQDVKKASNLKRVSSIKNMDSADKPAFARGQVNGVDAPVFGRVPSVGDGQLFGRTASVDTPSLGRVPSRQGSRSGSCLPEREYSATPPESTNSGRATPAEGIPGRATPVEGLPGIQGWSRSSSVSREEKEVPRGHARINTLWGVCIKEHAKMCIPDLEVLTNYPIDYNFPAFAKDKAGNVVGSGFFPADPISLHINPTPTNNNRSSSQSRAPAQKRRDFFKRSKSVEEGVLNNNENFDKFLSALIDDT